MALDAITAFIDKYHGARTALVCHQRPDGDALGSCIALADLLTSRGTPARVVNATPLPSYLEFLTRDNSYICDFTEADWHTRFDCLGVLDCGEPGRLAVANLSALSQLPTFNIDHHATSAGVGEAVWVDASASSVGEMVASLAKKLDWNLTPLAAAGIWTAIVTDTGRFSYENTSVNSMEAALWCLRTGIDPSAIAGELYQSVTWQERQLQRLVLDKMELLEDGRLAVSGLSRNEFRQAGSGAEGAQNLINLLRDTAGVNIALFLYELPEAPDDGHAIKVSMRTRAPYNALDIVCRFGGGGHARAAGCSLTGSMDDARERVIETIRREWFRRG